MGYAVSLPILVVLLGILVLVHEMGHYIAAKRAGMRCDEFAFGFGPKIAHLFNRGETEFNIRAFPLGGFVKIVGMEPGDEQPDGYNSAPKLKRAGVVFAGPLMSLLFGYFVFLLIGFIWGFPTATSKIAGVSKDTPAARAGLLKGDEILSINGKKYADGEEMKHAIQTSDGKELALVINRAGKAVTVKATPKHLDPEQGGYQLGILLDKKIEHPGVIKSLKLGTQQTYEIASNMVKTLFSKQIKKEVGGIVAIGYMTNDMVKQGAMAVIFELAALSLMLGIVNLIPWPVLDGGHLLYLAIDSIVEKVRGKRLAPETWLTIQTIGVVVIISLAIFLVYFDIARIKSGTFPRG